ncbi:MAG: T9SS type A sorting domain-containing protein [Crocinitomicaceae bacterium]|nr:T9SS type A sorting domain-containing protein [Crocinitomicaceae bacterium]
MKIFIYVFMFVVLLGESSLFAQPYTHPTTGIQSEYVGACVVMDCGPSTYYDNGGTGNYSNNINQIYRTFCPSVAGRCMRVTFNSFDTEFNYDYLTIGNGPTQNSPVFTTSPANGSGRIWGTPAVPFSYTSTDDSGCLTFRFRSDGSSVRAGWDATLQCVPCANGPTGTANSDCINATAVCSNAPISSLSTGPGIVSEYCNGTSCPAGGENFSNWYQFVPQTSGTLSILITPNNAADDFDFYIFQASSCSSLGSPIRCSDSGASGPTGATNVGGVTSVNVNGSAYIRQLTVTAGQRYYLVVDKWSPVGTNGYTISFGGSASLNCVILGLDMQSFEAEYQPDLNAVDLNWVTKNEDNMSHFDVEHSVDGVNFELLSRVKAVGNTNYETEYLISDLDPFPGVNYYRLRMFDYDGKNDYSETRVVNVLDANYDILSVFPNPVTDLTEVIFNSYSKEDASLEITDATGKQILTQSIPVVKGGNRLKLNLQELKNGIYLVKIETKYKTHRTRIVKN